MIFPTVLPFVSSLVLKKRFYQIKNNCKAPIASAHMSGNYKNL